MIVASCAPVVQRMEVRDEEFPPLPAVHGSGLTAGDGLDL
jgi:hypothetical protein